MTPKETDQLLARADSMIEFYGADPQGIGTPKPCECAQAAINYGFMELAPECKAHGCKEMRKDGR